MDIPKLFLLLKTICLDYFYGRHLAFGISKLTSEHPFVTFRNFNNLSSDKLSVSFQSNSQDFQDKILVFFFRFLVISRITWNLLLIFRKATCRDVAPNAGIRENSRLRLNIAGNGIIKFSTKNSKIRTKILKTLDFQD